MPQLQYVATVSGLGGTITQPITRIADGGIPREIAVPIGYAGQLTTRSDDNTGTVTLAANHAISSSDPVDIYWDGGVQYDVTVGTVSVNAMPFDTGIGDNLPTVNTMVVVAPRVEFNAEIDGDNLVLIALKQHYPQQNETAASHVDFQATGAEEITELDLVANIPQVWDVEGGSSNPFAGNTIIKGFVSNGSVTNPATFQLLGLADSTP